MTDTSSEDVLWNCYNTLLLSNGIDRTRKILTRYELFHLTVDTPGDVVEAGVFKGAGWMFWLKLLKLYASGEHKRVVGFDTFGSFASSLVGYEKETAKSFTDEANFQGIDPKGLMQYSKDAKLGVGELVSGDVLETIPKYVSENSGFRISLLNLDLDTYHGTKVALEHFFPLVTPGGIIILDEYGMRGWGESDAVDEYFSGIGEKIKINACRDSTKPTAFIQKPL